MEQTVSNKLQQAESIVNAYGAILAEMEQVNTAYPVSLLPHSKEEIKEAIQTLLWELEDAEPNVRNGLIQAFVYLEQFIPDNKVEILTRGQAAIQSADPEHADWKFADEANRIITQIKVAMEDALNEMSIYIKPANQ
jgi:hypothetical protein